MTALLLYAYSRGIHASRRIALACAERVDFMAVQQPDLRTISDFRKRHLQALSGLFVQVLSWCREAEARPRRALDGTRIKANASKHKAMSYGRMVKAEAALAEEVAGWLKAAEAADGADDAALGADRRGDEMPDWVADTAKRLARIRKAKAALEAAAPAAAEARATAAAAETGPAADRGADTATEGAAPPVTPPSAKAANETPEAKAPDTRVVPKAKAQRDFPTAGS